MITLLYDLDSQTPGEFREGRYIVDGQTGIFPSNYVELIVQDPPYPQYDPLTQKVEYSNYYADINNLLWTRNINVIEKTQEEINEERIAEINRQKEKTYQDAINAGYQIPDTQIYLGLTDQDRSAWNQLLTLINELLSVNQITLSTELSISDKDGAAHIFQVSQIKQILAGLGMYYYQIWSQRKSPF
jgi:hypothetical protein